VKTQIPALDVAPSNQDLVGVEIEFVSLEQREQKLRALLKTIQAPYDYCIIDCPPSLGFLTLNALVAADYLIIPLQCEYFALEGLAHLLNTVKLVRSRMNPSLALGGILLTMFDVRNRLSHRVVEEVRGHFGNKVFKTVIPRNVRISESPSHGLPIILYDVKSRGPLPIWTWLMKSSMTGEPRMLKKNSLGKGLGAMFPDLLERSGTSLCS